MIQAKSTIPTSRRALLAGAPAVAAAALAGGTVANALAIAEAKAAEVDPIFAAIAEHRARMRAWADAMEADDMAETDEAFEAATDAMDATSEAFEASIGPVLTVQPTTIAGVAALLEHVGQEEFLGMSRGGDRDHYETVLTTWLNTDSDDPKKRIAQDFPLRLGETLRGLIGEARA
jgi:hypothetical protein